MRGHPIFYTYNDKNYSTNCSVGSHVQCSGVEGMCECGCHSNEDFPTTIAEAIKVRLERAKKYHRTHREEINKKVRLMRIIGRWKG